LYELITARLPILANDLPYLRDVVAGNGFGLIRKLETGADFAAAIDEMFEDFPAGVERFRESMIKSGNSFAWSAEEQKLLSLYRPLVTTVRGMSDRAAHPSRAGTQVSAG
jgi:glycosyltransferase involved in cell wall biosynthesis